MWPSGNDGKSPSERVGGYCEHFNAAFATFRAAILLNLTTDV